MGIFPEPDKQRGRFEVAIVMAMFLLFFGAQYHGVNHRGTADAFYPLNRQGINGAARHQNPQADFAGIKELLKLDRKSVV